MSLQFTITRMEKGDVSPTLALLCSLEFVQQAIQDGALTKSALREQLQEIRGSRRSRVYLVRVMQRLNWTQEGGYVFRIGSVVSLAIVHRPFILNRGEFRMTYSLLADPRLAEVYVDDTFDALVDYLSVLGDAMGPWPCMGRLVNTMGLAIL